MGMAMDSTLTNADCLRVHAVINRRSGAALDDDMEQLAGAVAHAVQTAGHIVSVDLVEPEEIEAKLDAAVASNPNVIIVGGGDGTVRAAAARVLRTEIAIAILPLGTVNRLARDLKIPLNPLVAINALVQGELREIDVAQVNDNVFLCNSFLGLPPRISDERQRFRGKPLLTRIRGCFQILRTILYARHRIRLTIDSEEQFRRIRVLSLAVSNNVYSQEPGLFFTRAALDRAELGLYISKHRSGLGLLWILIKAAAGQWSGDLNFIHQTAQKITIHSARPHLRLANDGEVESLSTPLHYQIHPKALRVLAPKTGS
jgi:diacylglycerol kinase family enzyme